MLAEVSPQVSAAPYFLVGGRSSKGVCNASQPLPASLAACFWDEFPASGNWGSVCWGLWERPALLRKEREGRETFSPCFCQTSIDTVLRVWAAVHGNMQRWEDGSWVLNSKSPNQRSGNLCCEGSDSKQFVGHTQPLLLLFFSFFSISSWFVLIVKWCLTLCDTMDDSPPGPSVTTISWVCSDSLPMSWRCYPAISFSAAPVSFCSQSFSASGSFPMNHLFTSGGQNIRVSALASGLPMNIQDWFPLGWTGLISLLSNGLSRVFSNTRFRKHYWFWVVQKQRGWIGPTGERLMTPSLNRPSDHLCVGCLFRNMIQRQTVS